MSKSEIEERIALIEQISRLVSEERRAYGVLHALWGIAIFAGFSAAQLVVYASAPWTYLVACIATSLGLAAVLHALIRKRIQRELGGAGAVWLSIKIGISWFATAFIGGACAMLWFFNVPEFQAILEAPNPYYGSSIILLIWFIIDGIGVMITGVLVESKEYFAIGAVLCALAPILAATNPIHAWAVFGAVLGLGYFAIGIRDYARWKRAKQGV